MQLMFESSEEDGGIRGLGLLRAGFAACRRVRRFPTWAGTAVELRGDHPAFADIPNDSYFYFVHSYYPGPADRVDTSWARPITEFASPAWWARDNLLGVQFHPEKSGELGLRLYDNFVRRCVQPSQR